MNKRLRQVYGGKTELWDRVQVRAWTGPSQSTELLSWPSVASIGRVRACPRIPDKCGHSSLIPTLHAAAGGARRSANEWLAGRAARRAAGGLGEGGGGTRRSRCCQRRWVLSRTKPTIRRGKRQR